jgi:hypothetical protein
VGTTRFTRSYRNSNIDSLLNSVEPWVMVSAVGEDEYYSPLFVATKVEAAPLSTRSSISTDDPFCETPSWSPP